MLRNRADIVALLLVPLTFIIVFKVSGGIGLTWDEPTYIKQSQEIIKWAGEMKSLRFLHSPKATEQNLDGDKAGQNLQSPHDPKDKFKESIRKHWHFGPALNRLNPPFAQEVQAISIALLQNKLGKIRAGRIGTIILFSIAAALLFRLGIWAEGWVGGLAAYGFLLTMPRVMGHACLAATDSPAMAMGFIVAAVCLRYALTGRGAFLLAVIFAFTALTKVTAVFSIPALVIWAWLFKKKWLKGSIYLVVITPIAMVLFNPRWWLSPIEDIRAFITLSLMRRKFLPIPTYYLDTLYEFDLPWHHPPVMIISTLPLMTLIAAFIGIGILIKRKFKDEKILFFFLPLLAYMLSFELPNAPGHGGARLFMPVFPFIAGLAGIGVARLAGAIEPLLSKLPSIKIIDRKKAGAVLLGIFLIPPAVSLARIHPYELEYFSSVVGGVRGAHRLGFETTYWIDVLNSETLPEVNRVLPKDAEILHLYQSDVMEFLQSTGLLRKDIKTSTDNSRYHIQFARQGMFTDGDWLLYRYATPLYEKKLEGVRLMAVFETGSMSGDMKIRVEKYIASHPEDLRGYYDMGIILLSENPGLAVQYFRKALPLEKKIKRVRLNIGESLAAAGDFKGAETELKAVIALYPNTPKPYNALARAYIRFGKLNKAEQYFKLALEKRVNDTEAILGLSNIAKIRRQWSPIK